MSQETNQLHKSTAITAAIVMSLNILISLYTCFDNFHNPLFTNLWHRCTILFPIGLNLITAIFLFRRKKDVVTGCVFLLQLLYPFMIAPIFYNLWMATDHVIVQSDVSSWSGMFLAFTGSAYLLLLAIDCFLSSKQTLRNARIAFLILPILSVVCNIIRTLVSYQEANLSLDPQTIFALGLSFVISYTPTILTGLSFFFSYRSTPTAVESTQW